MPQELSKFDKMDKLNKNNNPHQFGISPKAVVHEYAYVEDNVGLRKGVHVARICRILGPSLVGRNSVIQVGSEINTGTVIGSCSSIGKHVRIGVVMYADMESCSRNNRTVIGNNVQILRHATLEHNVMLQHNVTIGVSVRIQTGTRLGNGVTVSDHTTLPKHYVTNYTKGPITEDNHIKHEQLTTNVRSWLRKLKRFSFSVLATITRLV